MPSRHERGGRSRRNPPYGPEIPRPARRISALRAGRVRAGAEHGSAGPPGAPGPRGSDPSGSSGGVPHAQPRGRQSTSWAASPALPLRPRRPARIARPPRRTDRIGQAQARGFRAFLILRLKGRAAVDARRSRESVTPSGPFNPDPFHRAEELPFGLQHESSLPASLLSRTIGRAMGRSVSPAPFTQPFRQSRESTQLTRSCGQWIRDRWNKVAEPALRCGNVGYTHAEFNPAKPLGNSPARTAISNQTCRESSLRSPLEPR